MNKKDFIPNKDICVATRWWRVPMIDSPESNLCRKGMLERVDHDPLSQKTITIYKAKGRTVVKNRDGNPVSIAAYLHKHSTSKEDLEAIHNLVMDTVLSGDVEIKSDIDLKSTIEGYYNAENSTGGKTEQDSHIDSGTERPVA